jgi:hypothetical protein
VSDRNHPDLDRATYLFILNRGRAAAGDLIGRLTSAASALEKNDHLAVLGELALAEIQLQHLRAIVRLLAT